MDSGTIVSVSTTENGDVTDEIDNKFQDEVDAKSHRELVQVNQDACGTNESD